MASTDGTGSVASDRVVSPHGARSALSCRMVCVATVHGDPSDGMFIRHGQAEVGAECAPGVAVGTPVLLSALGGVHDVDFFGRMRWPEWIPGWLSRRYARSVARR
jgi:hypothetical protein